MRSRWLSTTAAVVVTGLWALTSVSPALAQNKTKPAAPAGKAPAKPAAKPGPKAAAPAKPMSEKQKKDAARKAYKEGEAKFKDGKYEAALEAYKTADDLLPIPATKYKMAVCRDKLGQVVDAVASYQLFLDSSPPSDKMADAIADAKQRLDALKRTPGKLRLAIEPANAAKVLVQVDALPPAPAAMETIPLPPPPPPAPGQPATAPATAKGVTLTLAPGHHKIAAMAPGYDPAATEVDVRFAETKDAKITLTLTPPPPPPPPPPPVVAQQQPPPPPPPPAPRSNVPAYVTLGLAGAGLVVGGVFGGLALKSKSDFNKTPTTDIADKTDRNALIADMSFAVALTFGVTGAVLLLSHDSPAPDQKAAVQDPPKKSAVRGFVTPYFSPQGGGAAAVLTF